ncbi:alpha-L-rhamnosidase [Pedobacter sp. UYEF25]
MIRSLLNDLLLSVFLLISTGFYKDGNCRAQTKQINIETVKCNSRTNPLGVDIKEIAFSWIITSKNRNVSQRAYQILVAENKADLDRDKASVWNSKKVNDAQSIYVIYHGKALQAAKRYYWKVRVWDNKGNISAWSKPAFWQMGLLKTADWKGADWIGFDTLAVAQQIVPAVHGLGKPEWGSGKDILPLLRRTINVNRPIERATMYISGLGHFDLSINGRKIGDHFLDPGWTKYDKQAQYVTFDVTQQLSQGLNTLGVMLGNGFYYIPRERYRKITGAFGYPKMICRLVLQYTDGSTENIISDDQWKVAAGPITYSSIYGGEDFNANLEKKGWDTPAFNAKGWKKAIITTGSPLLSSQAQEPIKIFERFNTKKISQPKPGVWVYDMGQNASAIPQLLVSGKKNAQVKLTPAELLNDDGTVNQSASGQPSYYQYTLNGVGKESWHPRFSYYGFRYVQVEGAVPEGKSNPDYLPVIHELTNLHVRNSAARMGTFNCSNQLFNRTKTLIDWAIRSNMMSVLTDCPHREKLGWLEEAHLMGASISYNYNVTTLYEKITGDMIISQTSNGLIPDIAPEYVEFDGGFRDSPEWGSSGIIVPWYTYQWYGDSQILRESYPMMQKYISYLQSKTSDNILTHGLGDWFDIGPKSPGESQLTPKGITATAIYYYDLRILTKIATLLNKPEDEIRYQHLAKEVRASFNKAFFNPKTKQYATGSQTANAMAVYTGLVNEEDKGAVIENLVQEIKGRNNALTAGDVGYRYVLRVLEDAGRSDVIFDMNSRFDVPGYGWQLAHGATALTESWQAYGFVSNNHFMLGHLMEWLYSGLAGIKAANNSIAFKEIEFKPAVVGDVTFANASYKSPYGIIKSAWKKKQTGFEFNVEVPVNSKGVVYFPNIQNKEVKEEGRSAKNTVGVEFLKTENGFSIFKVGSGSYSFSTD